MSNCGRESAKEQAPHVTKARCTSAPGLAWSGSAGTAVGGRAHPGVLLLLLVGVVGHGPPAVLPAHHDAAERHHVLAEAHHRVEQRVQSQLVAAAQINPARLAFGVRRAP